jgi:hypothetical protein
MKMDKKQYQNNIKKLERILREIKLTRTSFGVIGKQMYFYVSFEKIEKELSDMIRLLK